MAQSIADRRIRLYRRQIQGSSTTILYYNSDVDDLSVWKWPIANGSRVVPSELVGHRLSHQFLGPGCLCPLKNGEPQNFVEAAIFRVTAGQFVGEYVASCAEDSCGYFVCMERMYVKIGLPVKSYALRAIDEPIPPSVRHRSEGDNRVPAPLSRGRPLKRAYAELDVLVPTSRAPVRPRTTPFTLLLRLDDVSRPGLTKGQVRQLLTRCTCGLIMMRRRFHMHDCRDGGIIDLTESDDSEDTAIDLSHSGV